MIINKLIDTSIIYDDGSKNERYTETGNIDNARFKAVPYEYDYSGGYTEKVSRYFIVYKRCPSGNFGNYLEDKKIKKYTIQECVDQINNYLKAGA